MKRTAYILLLLLFATTGLKGQNGLAGYEYWFDTDYENRQMVNSTATEIEIEADTRGLKGGIHAFRFRAIRDDGMPGILYTYNFLKPILDNYKVEELKCEWWVDHDYANRKLADGNGEGLILFDADISSVAPGMHHLNYHIADGNGEHAITYSHRFLRISADNNQYTAYACEYWFDDDFANRKRVENSNGVIAFDAEVEHLSAGIHRLNFRTVDEYGHWGAVYTQNFLRAVLDSNEEQSLLCEYWFDNDFEHRDTAAVASDGLVTFEADVSALKQGVHTFSYRLRHQNGDYGPAMTQNFVRILADNTEAKHVEYEYWFDEAFDSRQRGTQTGEAIDVELDASALGVGVHRLNLRFKTQDGYYSPVVTRDFLVPRYAAVASNVDKYAYWFDNQPADTVEVTPSNPFEIENMMFDVPAVAFPVTWAQTASVRPTTTTSDGKVMVTLSVEQERKLYMSFHNENDLWSSVDSTAFVYVNESVVEAQPLLLNRVYHISGLQTDSADIRYIDTEAGTLCLRTEQPCALRLYNDTMCIATLDAATLQAGTAINVPKAGRYYALLHVADVDAETVPESIKLICVTHPLPHPLHVAEAGTVADLLSFTSVADVKELVVTGSLNTTDLETLKTLDALRTLDLKAASVADNTLPERAFYRMTSLQELSLPTGVTAVGKEALGGMEGNLLVVRWNSMAPITAEVFDAPEAMGNCLVYAPEGVKNSYAGNVIVGGMAERITLHDAQPLRAPESFRAKQVNYSREFGLKTTPKQPGGWESIVLPFEVQRIVSDERGELAPFNSGNAGTHPFWLAELTDKGFAMTTVIKANTPYILSMPNSEAYEEEFNIRGKVTFSATADAGVDVFATTGAKMVSGAKFMLCPTYEAVAQSDAVYALNKEVYGEHVAGSAFIRDLRAVNPFEVYVHSLEAVTRAPMYYGIGIPGGEVTGIGQVKADGLRVWSENGVLYVVSDIVQALPLYTADGRMIRLLAIREGENRVTHLTPGLYVVAGKKVLVK